MKVSFLTYGCTMNQGDTEVLKALVAREHTLTKLEESEAVVLNTCAVVGFTERKILKKLRKLKAEGKKVLVAGCLSAYSPKKVLKAGADGVLTPSELAKVNRELGGAGEEGASKEKLEYPRLRAGESSIAIVPIAEGCLGRCSYCATRFARGRLKSFSPEAVVKNVKLALAQGYKEIQLTAQDTGCYGFDRGERLPRLLRRLTTLPGNFRLRVGMMNPSFAIRILDGLIGAYRDEKVYKFLHLPVQSGDNRVLEDMRRGYSVEDFKHIAYKFREAYPEMTLATDIIVGYPTESDASFERSLELIEEVKPEVLNITRYSPREGTPAAKLRGHHDYIKKQRSRKLTRLMGKIGSEKNSRLVGRRLKLLITKQGKHGTLLGRSNFYQQVVLEEGRIGEFKEVTVKAARSTYLIGQQ